MIHPAMIVMEATLSSTNGFNKKGESKMECDRCREDKDMWKELFPVKRPDHSRDNPKKWLFCKKCLEVRDREGKPTW